MSSLLRADYQPTSRRSEPAQQKSAEQQWQAEPKGEPESAKLKEDAEDKARTICERLSRRILQMEESSGFMSDSAMAKVCATCSPLWAYTHLWSVQIHGPGSFCCWNLCIIKQQHLAH